MLVVRLKSVKSILSSHLCKLSVLSKGRSVIEIGEIANLVTVNVVHLTVNVVVDLEVIVVVIVIGSLELNAHQITMISAAEHD